MQAGSRKNYKSKAAQASKICYRKWIDDREAPTELIELTDVELALISLGRMDTHVFAIFAGAHQAMKGWHTMYANDVSVVNGVANWCIKNTERGDVDDIDSHYSTEEMNIEGTENMTLDNNYSSLRWKHGNFPKIV